MTNKGLILSGLLFALLLVIHLGSADKDIPISRLGQNVGPTMTFLYCYSCGYRKAFDEYTSILNEKYPELLITGANYDPPGMNLYLSKSILFIKFVLIIAIMSSFDIWGYLGHAIPAWYRWCSENKLYACMMVFFVGNMLEAQLISSGAFEISLNDVPIWSKLQTARIPAPQELFQIIDSHFQFSNEVPDFGQ